MTHSREVTQFAFVRDALYTSEDGSVEVTVRLLVGLGLLDLKVLEEIVGGYFNTNSIVFVKGNATVGKIRTITDKMPTCGKSDIAVWEENRLVAYMNMSYVITWIGGSNG